MRILKGHQFPNPPKKLHSIDVESDQNKDLDQDKSMLHDCNFMYCTVCGCSGHYKDGTLWDKDLEVL